RPRRRPRRRPTRRRPRPDPPPRRRPPRPAPRTQQRKRHRARRPPGAGVAQESSRSRGAGSLAGRTHMTDGLWITFEGGDGSGKTTQAERLREWFEQQGRAVVRTREPGGTEAGKTTREIVLHSRGELDDRTEALLFAADRAHHIHT